MSVLQQPTPAIILVEPQHPGNIGAVCRSMQNFGLDKLILVNPTDYRSNTCKIFAIHAFSIAEQAEVYSSLEEALAHVNLSFGFTRRQGRFRSNDGHFHHVLENLFKHQYDGLETSAFVFGREKSGLNQEEALQCSFLVELPTDSPNGSMNLSHAVTCACYELRRTSLTQPQEPLPAIDYPDLIQARQQTFSSLVRLLDSIDFYTVEPPHIIHQHLKRWLEKSLMTAKDLRFLSKLTEKLRRISHETRES